MQESLTTTVRQLGKLEQLLTQVPPSENLDAQLTNAV